MRTVMIRCRDEDEEEPDEMFFIFSSERSELENIKKHRGR